MKPYFQISGFHCNAIMPNIAKSLTVNHNRTRREKITRIAFTIINYCIILPQTSHIYLITNYSNGHHLISCSLWLWAISTLCEKLEVHTKKKKGTHFATSYRMNIRCTLNIQGSWDISWFQCTSLQTLDFEWHKKQWKVESMYVTIYR